MDKPARCAPAKRLKPLEEVMKRNRFPPNKRFKHDSASLPLGSSRSFLGRRPVSMEVLVRLVSLQQTREIGVFAWRFGAQKADINPQGVLGDAGLTPGGLQAWRIGRPNRGRFAGWRKLLRRSGFLVSRREIPLNLAWPWQGFTFRLRGLFSQAWWAGKDRRRF